MTSHRNGHAGWEGENLEKTIKFYQEYNNCEVNQQFIHMSELQLEWGWEDWSFSASVGWSHKNPSYKKANGLDHAGVACFLSQSEVADNTQGCVCVGMYVCECVCVYK